MIAKSTKPGVSLDNAPLSGKPIPFWNVVKATVVKDLQIRKRYLPDLLGFFAQLIVRVIFFLIISSFIVYKGPIVLNSREIFVFFIAAFLTWIFSGNALYAPVDSVNSDLLNGTLEFIYSNPIYRYGYYVGTVIANTLVDLVVFVPFYIFLIWYAGLNFFLALSIILVCFLVLAAMMALGIMLALLALLWRQVTSLLGILFLLFEMVAGAYFPVAQYPKALQYLAYTLPYTWGYDLARYFALKGHWNTIFPIWVEWTFLGVYAIFYTVLSSFLLKKVEMTSKKQGLHII